jgi:hypothetical protein
MLLRSASRAANDCVNMGEVFSGIETGLDGQDSGSFGLME